MMTSDVLQVLLIASSCVVGFGVGAWSGMWFERRRRNEEDFKIAIALRRVEDARREAIESKGERERAKVLRLVQENTRVGPRKKP